MCALLHIEKNGLQNFTMDEVSWFLSDLNFGESHAPAEVLAAIMPVAVGAGACCCWLTIGSWRWRYSGILGWQ